MKTQIQITKAERKTKSLNLRLTETVMSKIKEVAKKHKVNESDLVRYILENSELLKNGN